MSNWGYIQSILHWSKNYLILEPQAVGLTKMDDVCKKYFNFDAINTKICTPKIHNYSSSKYGWKFWGLNMWQQLQQYLNEKKNRKQKSKLISNCLPINQSKRCNQFTTNNSTTPHTANFMMCSFFWNIQCKNGTCSHSLWTTVRN